MVLIKIKPVPKYRRTFGWNCRVFEEITIAAEFMQARYWNNWNLYINGRLYAWPREDGLAPISNIDPLVEHIEDCIEIDEAFYASD